MGVDALSRAVSALPPSRTSLREGVACAYYPFGGTGLEALSQWITTHFAGGDGYALELDLGLLFPGEAVSRSYTLPASLIRAVADVGGQVMLSVYAEAGAEG